MDKLILSSIPPGFKCLKNLINYLHKLWEQKTFICVWFTSSHYCYHLRAQRNVWFTMLHIQKVWYLEGHLALCSHHEYHDVSEELPAAVITVGDVCPLQCELDIAQQPRCRKRHIPLERLHPIWRLPVSTTKRIPSDINTSELPCIHSLSHTFICRYALMRLHEIPT